MKPLHKHFVCVLGIVFSLTVGGCGSENDSNPAPEAPSTSSSAEGFWEGSTSTNRTIATTILDDGTYYTLYSAPGDPTWLVGVIQGTGTSNNGSFTSTNARDFSLEGLGVLSATISASYAARQSLSGSITYHGSGGATFTSTFNHDYDTPPSLDTLAGTYTGSALSIGGTQSASVTVASTGEFSGVEASGCSFTGTATPRVHGNVFDHRITFGPAPCVFAGSTVVGLAYLNRGTNTLFAFAPTSTRTDIAVFFGTKP